jgi:hypothetical protein
MARPSVPAIAGSVGCELCACGVEPPGRPECWRAAEPCAGRRAGCGQAGAPLDFWLIAGERNPGECLTREDERVQMRHSQQSVCPVGGGVQGAVKKLGGRERQFDRGDRLQRPGLPGTL